MKTIAQLDLFRNTAAPLQGIKSNTWGYAGSCLTAQAAIFHPEAFSDMVVARAIWRLTWLPNINNGAQTAVRICSADSGPSNLTQMAAFFGSNNTTNPRNDAIDITAAVNDLIASHKISGEMFQITHQSCGDGTFGPLIYSSSIELVFAS